MTRNHQLLTAASAALLAAEQAVISAKALVAAYAEDNGAEAAAPVPAFRVNYNLTDDVLHDERNKVLVGGERKFTPRGIELTYRLLDQSMNPHQVAKKMRISDRAARHRVTAYQNAGGKNRKITRLDIDSDA